MKSTNPNKIQTTGDQPVAIKSANPPRRLLRCLAMAALAGFATSAQAAIPVGASGSGTLTFDSLPAATEWAMLSVTGGAGDVTTDAGLDGAMSSIAASGITGTLATQAGSGTNGSAYWRSGDLKLGTQPTGNKMTLLMATLQNTSGGAINGLTVAYTLGLPDGHARGRDQRLPGLLEQNRGDGQLDCGGRQSVGCDRHDIHLHGLDVIGLGRWRNPLSGLGG